MPSDPDRSDDLFDELRELTRRQSADDDPAALAASLADRYELVGTVARGGQAWVYRGRCRSTGDAVAIKVPLRGSAASLRDRYRFEQEIELVRGLAHPGIVQVRDHGYAADRLFYVMDWVDGTPLDAWRGDGRELGQVLRLFDALCAAVRHAHARGVIHRDLKPANILVDADDQPHVLDFGIARALPSSQRRITLTGEFVGTLAYAPPETLHAPEPPIDTRADVYSLGVLLFELLSGRLPHDTSGSLGDVVQRLTDGAPRTLDAPGIDRDLRTIVQTAMHRDLGRRYATVEALADDLDRYRGCQPIRARRDSTPYAFVKWLQRNRVRVVAAAVTITALGGAWAWTEISRRERDRTRLTSEEVSQLFRSTLSAAAPSHLGAKGTAPDVLAVAANQLADTALAGAPAVKAELHFTLGVTYHRLWMPKRAFQQLELARRLFETAHGSEHCDVARCLLAQGRLATELRSSRALDLLSRGLAILERQPDTDPVRIASARGDLAGALAAREFDPDLAQARRASRQALDTLCAHLEPGHLERERAQLRQILLDAKATEPGPLEQSLRQSVERLRPHARTDAALAVRAMTALAALCIDSGRERDAVELFDEAVTLLEQTYGREHAPRLVWLTIQEQVRSGSALAASHLARRAIALELDLLRREAPEHGDALARARQALLTSDAAAAETYAPLLRLRIEIQGIGRYELAAQSEVLGAILERTGHVDLADRLMDLSLKIHCREFGDRCPHRVRNLVALGELRLRHGRADSALTLLREALAVQTEVQAPPAAIAHTRDAIDAALRATAGRPVK